jgi:hypothetical protein
MVPHEVSFAQILKSQQPPVRAQTGQNAVCFATMSMMRAKDVVTARADQNEFSFVRKRTMPLLRRVQGGARAR